MGIIQVEYEGNRAQEASRALQKQYGRYLQAYPDDPILHVYCAAGKAQAAISQVDLKNFSVAIGSALDNISIPDVWLLSREQSDTRLALSVQAHTADTEQQENLVRVLEAAALPYGNWIQSRREDVNAKIDYENMLIDAAGMGSIPKDIAMRIIAQPALLPRERAQAESYIKQAHIEPYRHMYRFLLKAASFISAKPAVSVQRDEGEPIAGVRESDLGALSGIWTLEECIDRLSDHTRKALVPDISLHVEY